MKYIFVGLSLFCLIGSIHAGYALALVDPHNVPNNKVCVGTLSPEADTSDVAAMVNAGSDWGYVVLVIKKSERDIVRWQGVMNQLSKNHLIPIVRIATSSDSQGNWLKPTDEDAGEWVNFLSKLYFPTQNKYIQIYNEVNRAGEWGGTVDPASYARELSHMIDALKSRDSNFFILNAPLDLALTTSRDSMEAGLYLLQMQQSYPGIFSKLDGWASHSYPNPAFSASPYKSGRLGIDGYKWELLQIGEYTGGKNLSVFITETGWRRSDILDEDKISSYYSTAFSQIWTDNRLVAVCPFIFNYPDAQFHEFSFKTDSSILGKSYYNYYYKIQELSKIVGKPIRENLLGDTKFSFPDFALKDNPKTAILTIRNSGNFIWDAKNALVLNIEADGVDLVNTNWSRDEVYPGQEATVEISLTTRKTGDLPFTISLLDNNQVLMVKNMSIVSETQLARLIRVVTNLI